MRERFREKYGSLAHKFKGTLRQARREAEYRSSHELTDFELLERSDGYLADVLGKEGFERLKVKIASSERSVVDIGAGSDPLKGLIFFNAIQVTCVDPAYKWYEYRPKSFYEKQPFPANVYGGAGSKQEMIDLLKASCKKLKMPERIEGRTHHVISSIRHNEKVTFELIPESISAIAGQDPNTIPNIVLWRVFPTAKDWGKLIEGLKEGGVIITTGYGRTRGNFDYRRVSCGEDVDNSTLPRNGNFQALGLEGLTNVPDVYFYRKVQHLPADVLLRAIRENM